MSSPCLSLCASSDSRYIGAVNRGMNGCASLVYTYVRGSTRTLVDIFNFYIFSVLPFWRCCHRFCMYIGMPSPPTQPHLLCQCDGLKSLAHVCLTSQCSVSRPAAKKADVIVIEKWRLYNLRRGVSLLRSLHPSRCRSAGGRNIRRIPISEWGDTEVCQPGRTKTDYHHPTFLFLVLLSSRILSVSSGHANGGLRHNSLSLYTRDRGLS